MFLRHFDVLLTPFDPSTTCNSVVLCGPCHSQEEVGTWRQRVLGGGSCKGASMAGQRRCTANRSPCCRTVKPRMT